MRYLSASEVREALPISDCIEAMVQAFSGERDGQSRIKLGASLVLLGRLNSYVSIKSVSTGPGDETGIKASTITVKGDYSYGLLLAEAGIHRLVRISPFDQAARRHTSFASVFVWPELSDDIEIEIEEKDLRIDTYRSSGAGGQHVNVTDSAVRITHLPTGIVVSCQNERSQHRNRDAAMSVLRSRLYDVKQQEQRDKLERIGGEKKEIAFGSQIRSYVLHPYRLVKDHRTKMDVGNVDRILDGDLDDFIKCYLMRRAAGTLGVEGKAENESGQSTSR